MDLYSFDNWQPSEGTVPPPYGIWDCDNSEWTDELPPDEPVPPPEVTSGWSVSSGYVSPPQIFEEGSHLIREGYEYTASIARKEVQRIIDLGEKYTDPDFSITCPEYMLYTNPEKKRSRALGEYAIAKWARITEVVEEAQLYADGIDSKDIAQGILGSCWFLSSLSVLGGTPGRIEKCLVAHSQELGVYGFVFYKNAKWISVIIDGRIYFHKYFPNTEKHG
jgi:hypothetical protein